MQKVAHFCTITRVKISKTWGIIGFVLLTVVSFSVSIKLGVAVAVACLITKRLIWGSSGSDSIIGVDHVDRPHSSSYGGGFSPGGIYGGGNLGTSFGVWGAEVSDVKGPRKEYHPLSKKPALSKKQRKELAAAIIDAEARTGHQVVTVVGSLDEERAAKADRVAAEWPSASIVVCLDPTSKLFELRWRDASFALDSSHVAKFAQMVASYDFASAIALLTEVLPVQAAGADLPDIVED